MEGKSTLDGIREIIVVEIKNNVGKFRREPSRFKAREQTKKHVFSTLGNHKPFVYAETSHRNFIIVDSMYLQVTMRESSSFSNFIRALHGRIPH